MALQIALTSRVNVVHQRCKHTVNIHAVFADQRQPQLPHQPKDVLTELQTALTSRVNAVHRKCRHTNALMEPQIALNSRANAEPLR
ncbi:unnamed protein product [Bursaphelenchus xylophilus]|uniref:(pine wood nematode) hypothetical protein n=1 Tax=Bursaphelenchus xylophilus TaxID=6326 RepID=A0A811LBE2_BURXY|nr:unnamed protein product [Bursaphelenchus xylophilus]CAG9113381.1 unnamed protein product [Bursaphelenchus xylophilus]